MRSRAWFLVVVLGATVVVRATPAAPENPPHSTVFYQSGGLRIEAYLYTPPGNGPFPLVIYNHGSRAGRERVEAPFPFVGRVLTNAGYAVLVPERRGYGQSGGQTFAEEVGNDKGVRFLARQRAEAGDALAALDYAATVPSLDRAHMAIMGWSFGGIVTVLAASQSSSFLAAVDQAGGSLSWNGSPTLQNAMRDAAGKIRIPVLCMVAENDATTNAVKTVYEAAKPNNPATALIEYPAFTPTQNEANIAPGHLIFSAQGVRIWSKDVVSFLDANVRK